MIGVWYSVYQKYQFLGVWLVHRVRERKLGIGIFGTHSTKGGMIL